MTLGAVSTSGVLTRFPVSFDELPQLHGLLLAVLVAHHGRSAEFLSRQQLVRTTVHALAEGVDIDVPTGSLARVIDSCLGDLINYEVVTSSVEGLALPQRTLGLSDDWDGAFRQLVAAVQALPR